MTPQTTTSSGIEPVSASRRERSRSRSGQAMTEAVIALCLLSFTWMITAYMLVLAENRVRCAAMGRHSAWMQAHNPGPLTPAQTPILENFFIRHKATMNPSGAQSVRSISGSAGGVNFIILSFLDALGVNPIRIQTKKQELEIASHPDDWILYELDDRRVPFMREVFVGMDKLGTATCEWANVENLLEDEDQVRTALGLPTP